MERLRRAARVLTIRTYVLSFAAHGNSSPQRPGRFGVPPGTLGRGSSAFGYRVEGALAVAPRPSLAPDPEALPGGPGALPGPSDRAIPTGFHALDAILGLGGLPRAATTLSTATVRVVKPLSRCRPSPRPRPPAE